MCHGIVPPTKGEETLMNELQRFRRVFSGKPSKRLWKTIGRLKWKKGRAGEPLYELGCKCQELEGYLNALERRVAELERGKR